MVFLLFLVASFSDGLSITIDHREKAPSKSKKDMYTFTLSQINEYENYALESKKTWCN